jgi:hypothetical protein
VEPFHLFRYIDEQAFRFNYRKGMNDSYRFIEVMKQAVGKRLTNAELTANWRGKRVPKKKWNPSRKGRGRNAS